MTQIVLIKTDKVLFSFQILRMLCEAINKAAADHQMSIGKKDSSTLYDFLVLIKKQRAIGRRNG